MVDFPGSNSLDYHSKTFSICGAMNNMVIVVVPFSGDVSEIHSQEIAKVFGVMKGSDSTRVILCMWFISKQIKGRFNIAAKSSRFFEASVY